MKRVMIIGCSGSGKSTLAKQLGKKTDLPVVHMDKFYWKKNWVLRPRNELLSLSNSVIAKEEWIFDGNLSSNFPERIKRTDTLVFLDMPRMLCLWRVIKRMLLHWGQSREDMGEDCPERFDWEFLKFVYGYKYERRPQAMELLNTVPQKVTTYHLNNNRQVKSFLDSI